jgi:hypothetical protein
VALYPNPDKEPEYPEQVVATQINKIRKQWRDKSFQLCSKYGPYGGYYLQRLA